MAVLAAVGLLAALSVSGAPTARATGEETTLIVQLVGAAAGPAQARASAAGDAFDLDGYTARLRAQQDMFLADLRARGISATPVMLPVGENGAAPGGQWLPARWTFVLNGLAIRAPAGAMALIQGMPGVRHVEPDDSEVRPLLAESVPYVGATRTWEALGARGEGQTIAVIDTGIDWTHPSFTDDPAAPPGPSHPKVKHYVTLTAGATDDSGHGTMVAGAAAADKGLGYPTGVLVRGKDLGVSRLDGVAPDADLWGYKVLASPGFGETTNVITAIEDAARRGATVVNLSLGWLPDDPDDAGGKAVDGAMLAGTFVAAAAGNDGPGYGTMIAPATARLGLAVGATTDPGDGPHHVVERMTGGRLPLGLFLQSPRPPAHPPIDTHYVPVGDGCTPAAYAGKLVTGRIVLVKRGTCNFITKTLLADQQGAVAALIYNNVDGPMPGTMCPLNTDQWPCTEEMPIPVGALSRADGEYLGQHVDPVSGLSTSNLLLDPNHTVTAGLVTGFSSRGPTSDHRIKPDVMAPGNSVTTATSKVGVPPTTWMSPWGYTTVWGTSLAAPHAAGAAALVRQLHPGWTPAEVKAALMNTARMLVDPTDGRPYSVLDQGAGLIDVHAAATTRGLLMEPSRSFGKVENYGGTVTRTATFLLKDVSGTRRTYRLSWEPGDGKNRGGEGRALPAEGFDATVSRNVVTVPPNGTAEFTLRVTADGRRLADGDYEGRVVAVADDQTLRAPVYYRNVHELAATGPAPVLFDPGGTSSTGSYTLTWSLGPDQGVSPVGYRVQEARHLASAFRDDAEGGLGNWTVTGTASAAGWRTSDVAYGGTQSFTALQAPDQSNSLTLQTPVTVPAGARATLSFWTLYDTEPGYDFGYVEASRDGTNWTVLAKVNGLSEGWQRMDLDLDAFAPGPVWVRFRSETDLAVDAGFHAGWFVDDIDISTHDWTTLAEPKAKSYRVDGRPNGTYFYRVGGLFNHPGEVRQGLGPWSNVVDIVVLSAQPG